MTVPRIAFVTLGCPKNEVDSDRMAASVTGALDVVADPSDADIVVVNTCSFIREATEESIAAVMELAADRGSRRIVVAGCMPSRYGGDLAASMPEADAFLPVAEEGGLVTLAARLLGRDLLPDPDAPSRLAGPASAYLQVADGCHRACTFCTIPAIRGPYRSRPLDELLEEARLLAAGGAREIVLVGQDISAWGRDLDDGPALADLVRALGTVPGLRWLRLMYVQPDGITPDLLEAMASTPAVCRYLDMPLQHASGRVLHSMGRRGSGAEYLRLIGTIRDFMPDVTLRTTLIAGFPGETREDARRLEAFLGDARLDYVGVFRFSPEEGTVAASLPDQVPARTARARAQRLRDIADAISFERVAARVGATLDVLVEGRDEDGELFGRHRGQAPEVDGVVLLAGDAAPGAIVSAEIVDSAGYDLIGRV